MVISKIPRNHKTFAILLAILLLALAITIIIYVKHQSSSRYAQLGSDAAYFENALSPEVEGLYSEQMSALGLTATAKMQRYCYMQMYIGGAWAPPADHLECRVGYTSVLKTSDNLKLDNLYDIALAQGFMKRTGQICQPPDFTIANRSNSCLAMYRGVADNLRPTDAIGCQLNLGTFGSSSPLRYDVWCKRLASEIPKGFLMIDKPDQQSFFAK